jgi:predicted aminopeptidase
VVFLRALKNSLHIALIIIVALATTACLPSYLIKSGYNEIKILDEREPIEQVLKEKNLAPETRHKLELALEARAFAESDLGLKATANYKTYVDLKRPYISWVVTAAKKFELTPHLYWYPIVGDLPYKGFFTREEADVEAANQNKDGYDTMLRGVTAYSTLGWFDDPLLNTMLDSEDQGLVNTIIHESTHATLYIKSQAEFNERMAVFVGNTGTELFYKKKEGENSATIKLIQAENEDERVFSRFISDEIRQIKEWYSQAKKPISEDDRQKRFEDIKVHFTQNIEPKLKTKNYSHFAKSKLNNAVLLYFNTYELDLSDFEKLYDHFNHSFPDFLKYCRTLEKSKDPSQELKTFLRQPQT